MLEEGFLFWIAVESSYLHRNEPSRAGSQRECRRFCFCGRFLLVGSFTISSFSAVARSPDHPKSHSLGDNAKIHLTHPIPLPPIAFQSILHSYIFLTYPSEQAATHALRTLDQTLFGKNRLHVNKFGDIERFSQMQIEEGGVPRGWVEEGEWTDKVGSLVTASRSD